MPRIATLDIGSNTCLLLIADTERNGLKPVVDLCRFPRLAQGLGDSGRLSTDAIARGHDVLREYRSLIDARGATVIRAVGTQALRAADNREEFLVGARSILGKGVEVIDGVREAALVYRAIAWSFPKLVAEGAVAIDVGGASTELAWAAAGGRAAGAISIPIGAVVLSERCLPSDPPTQRELGELRSVIGRAIETAELPVGRPLIAVAGTATTLAAVDRRSAEDDPEVEGHRMGQARLDEVVETLAAMTAAQRAALAGVSRGRADVIVAGGSILQSVLRRTQGSLTATDRGVRYGLALEVVDEASDQA